LGNRALIDANAGNDGDASALLGEVVYETLLMDFAALHKGIQGWIVAELWLGQFAVDDLEVEVCEVTTVQVPN
jgi:hypothetical protein